MRASSLSLGLTGGTLVGCKNCARARLSTPHPRAARRQEAGGRKCPRSLRGDGGVLYCRPMVITPHIVVRDAERAVAFYREAFAAEELSRIPTPDARLMSVQLRIGDG